MLTQLKIKTELTQLNVNKLSNPHFQITYQLENMNKVEIILKTRELGYLIVSHFKLGYNRNVFFTQRFSFLVKSYKTMGHIKGVAILKKLSCIPFPFPRIEHNFINIMKT